MSYDGRGNITQLNGNIFTYNLRNRMSTATAGELTTQYRYNALNERVYKKIGSQPPNLYVYGEENQILAELDVFGSTEVEYVYLNGRRLSMNRPAPFNDDYADRIGLEGVQGTIAGNNQHASSEEGEPNHAGSGTGRSLWYSFTPTQDGSLNVSMEGGITDAVIAIYVGGSLVELVEVGSNYNETESQVQVDVQAGQEYHIAIDGGGGDYGPIAFDWYFSMGEMALVLPPCMLLPLVGFLLGMSRTGVPRRKGMSLGVVLICLGMVYISSADAQQEGWFYFHTDHLDTPKAITNSSQQVVWEADYSPFGEASVESGIVNNLRFSGQYFDQETGLHYNYNRYYDPLLGRYLSSDPIGLEGGINTYTYTSNNPINFIDPYGLEVTTVCRTVQDWRTDLVGGMKHCSVFVWHWEVNKCTGVREKVIDRQFSVAANRVPFRQGSNKFTYTADTDAFRNPGNGNEHYPVAPPEGWSQSQFDQSVINAGTFYSSPEEYDAFGGPNSNTASNDIIEAAGGTPPQVEGAWRQNYDCSCERDPVLF